MDDLFAKKNKKKGKKKKVDLNLQLRKGVAMDTEDPTEKIQRLKNASAMKNAVTQATTDSDWSDETEKVVKKKVINTSGKQIHDLGAIKKAQEQEINQETLQQEDIKNMFHWTREQGAKKAQQKPKEKKAEKTALTWRDRERMKRDTSIKDQLQSENAFPTLGGRPVVVAKKATSGNNMWGQLGEGESDSDDDEEKKKEQQAAAAAAVEEEANGAEAAAPAPAAEAAAPAPAAEEAAPAPAPAEEAKKEEEAPAEDLSRFAGLKKKKKKKKPAA